MQPNDFIGPLYDAMQSAKLFCWFVTTVTVTSNDLLNNTLHAFSKTKKFIEKNTNKESQNRNGWVCTPVLCLCTKSGKYDSNE